MKSNKIYITVVVIGAAAAIVGILMKFRGGPSLQDAARILGWGGIGIMLIARILFGRRRSQPPTPRNNP
jgi:ABC-type cobalamin transport system permease subunit